MKSHIAVVNSHPIQYFAPLYAYLNVEPDLDITALYLSNSSIRGDRDPGFGRNVKWDLDLLAGYRSVFVGSRAERRSPAGFFSLIAPEIWKEIRSGRYDAVWLHGHNYAANLIALISAKSCGLPVLMRSETHLRLPRSRVKVMLRRPAMRMLYGLCDCFLAIGTANKEFHRAMGAADESIFVLPYAIDNDRFKLSAADKARARLSFRKKHRIADDLPVVLYASKFTKRKHPDDLIRASHRLIGEGLDFHLVMVGSGEMDAELGELVAGLGLTHVTFTGFVNQGALPGVYAASDVFVLPSEDEPWGLIVNEVMCAGLPVVVADEVGCTRDLVRHGDNGFTFPARDIRALADAVGNLITDHKLRRRMSEASLARIDSWSYRQCLDGLRAALGSIGL